MSEKSNKARDLAGASASPSDLRPGQTEKRRSVAKSSSPVSGIAERYAGSLYELAVQSSTVDQVEADLSRFEALLSESDDLSRMIRSPVFSAEEQFKAIVAIDARIDPDILGGLIVKVGSQMIDASLKTKLNRLAQVMKG